MAARPLIEAMSQAQLPDANGLAAAFFFDQRVKRITRSVLMSSGLPFCMEGDISQETYSIVSKYVDDGKVSNPEGIYSLVYSVAFNVARTIRHHESKNGANILASFEDGDEDGDRRLNNIIDEKASFDPGDAVDITRARNMIAQMMNSKKSDHMQTHPLISSEAPIIHVVKPPTARARGSELRDLGPAQKELFKIVSDLGYKHEEFAADIGIGMSRLASYLYGRTTTVPDDIMERARELKNQASPIVDRWKRQFGKPLPAIIEGWERALGLEVGSSANDEALAAILEINPVTIYRWRKEATTPRIHSIAKMDGRIQSEVERLSRRDGEPAKKKPRRPRAAKTV